MANQQNLSNGFKRNWIALICVLGLSSHPQAALSQSIPIKEIGQFGYGNGQLNGPTGLAIIGRSLLVADTQNHRIQRFLLSGAYEYTFKAIKDLDGDPATLESPVDIAVDPLRGIYVCDNGASQVVAFDPYGEFRHTIGSFGGIGVRFNDPVSVSIDAFGFLYITDSKNNRLIKADQSGKQVFQITHLDGNLSEPQDSVVTADGKIYVLDAQGIKLFNELGRFIKRVVPIDHGAQFAMDAKGQFYITRPLAGEVVITDIHGQIRHRIGHPFKTPIGVAISDDTLIVVDRSRHQILTLLISDLEDKK